MKFRFEPALRLLTALALAALAAPLCLGQQRSPRPNSTQSELQRTLERDLLFREMQEMAARGPAPQPTRQLAVAQINEDFERIQIINHALAQSSAAGEELDFRLVAQAASEIRKRAGRLRENLLLPEADKERPRSSDLIEPGRLKDSLAALDKLVNSFVSNPGFQSVGVVNPQWSARARGDLEGIIELTGRLKKSCEQLQKAAQKSH
ncbi:MAG: hypothetical protein JOZ02_13610 [Acidobacteria bacterium]|nr:hypothetical protein [Acidobacteriota bacterium]